MPSWTGIIVRQDSDAESVFFVNYILYLLYNGEYWLYYC